jgi:predicted esterase
MDTIAGFPYFPIEFSKDGSPNAQQRDAAIAGIPANVTDLYVVSHGWNNDMAEAKQLYDGIFGKLRNQLAGSPAAAKQIAVVGVFWPSKKFAENDLIPKGTALAVSQGVTAATVQARLSELASTLDDPASKDAVAAASKAVATIKNPDSQALYLESLRDALRREVGTPQPNESQEDASDRFFNDLPSVIFERLKVPPGRLPNPPRPGGGGALSVGGFHPTGPGGATGQGGAQGLGDFLRSFEQRALDIANFTTYYVMKKRAGTVGTNGVAPIIDAIHAQRPNLSIHLVGHSFGARLVTAVAAATKAPLNTLTLLQGAYSHNGLGQSPKITGFFRNVVTDKKVTGPILITHSDKDKAVGLAYPIASRLAGDNSKAIGDKNDQFGGMGANGAQFANADETLKITPGVRAFKFGPGKIFNLESNTVIDGHSSIVHDEIACAMLAAIST